MAASFASNWASGIKECVRPADQPTAFELETKRLRLKKESDWTHSIHLRAWVKNHKDTRWIPEWLLDLWGFDVDCGRYDHNVQAFYTCGPGWRNH